ncbi:hypothetical protein KI387_011142, partial [Taxus chinensis]
RENWQEVKWILQYVRGTMAVALCFGGSDITLHGHVNSDMAGDLDSKRSTT